MFLNFFYGLRDEGVPVGTQEWLALMDAIALNLHGSSLKRFYNVSRACLIKHEGYFDAFDRVFARVFQGVEGALDHLQDEIMRWLDDPKSLPELSPEELEALKHLDADELMRQFLETLAEQDERHDGGGRWVGTGGRSPYGNNGTHPTGIRVGGESRSRSAMKVAEERRYEDYRTDVALDVRNLRVALKRLRQLTRNGNATELDIDETIDETCRNAGEIEMVFRAPRRNDVRVVLLMDVGGTMMPYFEPVSRLLTALHEERGLRAFEAYYFHNCVYDYVYSSARMTSDSAVSTVDLMRKYDSRWKTIIVGDAAMHPAELLQTHGGIDPRQTTEATGLSWMQRIQAHFDRSVWLNPEEERFWDHSQTNRVLRRTFPMYHLSVDGVTEAVKVLVGVGRSRGARPA
ncbi:MAG: hypothetical protein ACI8TX_001527 [Hyphomicrobiaceae bacterium]